MSCFLTLHPADFPFLKVICTAHYSLQLLNKNILCLSPHLLESHRHQIMKALQGGGLLLIKKFLILGAVCQRKPLAEGHFLSRIGSGQPFGFCSPPAFLQGRSPPCATPYQHPPPILQHARTHARTQTYTHTHRAID